MLLYEPVNISARIYMEENFLYTLIIDQWLFNLKEPNSKLVCWRLRLKEFDCQIIYKKGKQNTNANALSRIEINALEDESIINHPGDVNRVFAFPFENPQPSTSREES